MKQEILIVIIAASSALGSVIISQAFSLFQSFLGKRHEKQKLLRQKYEEMMFHFSASLEWIQHLNGSTTQAEFFALSQSTDARKALSICLLYFPDLVDTANNYILAQQSYYESTVTSFKQVRQQGQVLHCNISHTMKSVSRKDSPILPTTPHTGLLRQAQDI